MRKFILTLSIASLFFGAAFNAGAEDRFFISVFPRVETQANFGPEEGYKPNFAYTSLYSNFAFRISDHWGLRMNNRWLTTDPASLYTNLCNPRNVNWLDILDLSYDMERWHFHAGKLYLRFGGFEFEAANRDFHQNLCSNFWMNVQPYTWGASVGYDISFDNRISFSVNNSPYSTALFKHGLMAYSLAWDGVVGPVQTYWGFVLMERADRSLVQSLGLGQRLVLKDFTAELDYTVRSDDWKTFFSRESSLTLKLAYEGSGRFQFHLKGGWEFVTEKESIITPEFTAPEFGGDFIVPMLLEPGRPFYFGGFYTYFFPLKNDRNLRLHLTVAANNYYRGAAVNAGILYRFDFKF